MQSMKHHPGAFLLALLVGVSGLVGAENDDAGLRDAVLQVDGMTCSSSAAGVEAMLAEIDGISEARVDLAGGRAYLVFDPERVDPAKVAAGISRDGIEARHLAGETPPPAVAASMSDADVERVVSWVVAQLTGASDLSGPIRREEIEAATGIAIPDADLNRLQSRLVAELESNHPAFLAKLTSGSRCAEYGACSLQGNLAGASGETLEMYEREKAEDGATYADFTLPDFEARDLQDNVVHSSSLRGQPTVLALLAGHCTHCHDSLPTLQEAMDTWGPKGVRVVGIVVNSGSVEDVNEWLPLTAPTYDIWVFNDDSLGDLLGSHLVPSYFFIDADGRVTEKLVGFKEKSVVLEKVADLAGSPGTGDAHAALGAR